MAQTIEECEKIRMQLNKQIMLNNDLQVITNFNNSFQVQAYARLSRHKEMIQLYKLIFKIVSEISAITGGLVAVLNIFFPPI